MIKVFVTAVFFGIAAASPMAYGEPIAKRNLRFLCDIGSRLERTAPGKTAATWPGWRGNRSGSVSL